MYEQATGRQPRTKVVETEGLESAHKLLRLFLCMQLRCLHGKSEIHKQ